MIGAVWTVWRKELRDALRDRRTLFAIVLSSVAIGPLVLVLLSALVAGIEQRAQARELVVDGIAHTPTLHNFLLRNHVRVEAAPPRFEPMLRAQQLGEPVLVIAADFESVLARGEPPRVELIFSSANPRAAAGAARVARLLQGFAQEQAMLRLTWRGVVAAGDRSRRARSRQPGGSGRAVERAAAVLRADGGGLRRVACGVGHDRGRA